MDPIEFVEIVEPEVTYQDSETVTYERTDVGKPYMTVTINNNEVSPAFKVPYYSLIVPHGYVINFDVDFDECEEARLCQELGQTCGYHTTGASQAIL